MKYRNQTQQTEQVKIQTEIKLEAGDVAVCENDCIVKPLAISTNMHSAAIAIGGKIADMKKQGYAYCDHISVSPGEVVLIFNKLIKNI